MKVLPVLLCLIYVGAAIGGKLGNYHEKGGNDVEKVDLVQDQLIVNQNDHEGREEGRHENGIKNIPLDILVHLEGIGDVTGHDNQWLGTKGQSRRLEGFSISPSKACDDFHLEYFAHLQDTGDTPCVSQGTFVGTRGQSRRLEGFAIRVVGKKANEYNVYYAAHLQDIGDTVEYKNNQFCGTRGQSRRVEAIKVRLEKKDD